MKIAICLPIYHGAAPRFVPSIVELVAFTLTARVEGPDGAIRPDLKPFMVSSANIAHSRRLLAEGALEWGAEWLFWVDADQTFPPDALLRLIAHGQGMIGANIRRRDASVVEATAVTLRDGEAVRLLPDGDGIEEVLEIGFGLCLTHAELSRKMDRPYFADEIGEDGIGFTSEDTNFCRKARAAGFPIFVDHGLSKEVGHMAAIELRFPP
ncbi:MAG: hypothetical protein JWP15_1218 [Alphaproteobacteria bacterium]|nr:hypothetical protein [Alphaproteobacteria bacterium]